MTPILLPEAVDRKQRWYTIRGYPAALLLAATGLFATSSDASAHGAAISVLGVQYSTNLTTTVHKCVFAGPITCESTTSTRTTTSTTPLHDQLRATPTTFAVAQADMFLVSTATSALPNFRLGETSNFAKATAQSVLTFHTLQDGLAPLVFDFIGIDQSVYSDGFVSLFDVTASQSMFDYAWTFPFSGTVPWDCTTSFGCEASLSLETPMLASHRYALTLHESTNADFDSQALSIQVSGLLPIAGPVPETSTCAMMFAGLSIVGLMIRRRTSRCAV